MSLLIRSKILRLFFNTLTANDNHSCNFRENFAQPIQKQFSKKGKKIAEFFIGFLKSK